MAYLLLMDLRKVWYLRPQCVVVHPITGNVREGLRSEIPEDHCPHRLDNRVGNSRRTGPRELDLGRIEDVGEGDVVLGVRGP